MMGSLYIKAGIVSKLIVFSSYIESSYLCNTSNKNKKALLTVSFLFVIEASLIILASILEGDIVIYTHTVEFECDYIKQIAGLPDESVARKVMCLSMQNSLTHHVFYLASHW